jgi:hypothetical protein
LTGRRRASVTHVDQMVRDLRKRLDDCRRTLRRHAPIVRQILMRLIVDRLVFESDPVARLYRFSGTATLRDLLKGVIGIPGKSAVTQGSCARRDSNPRPTGSKPVALSS